MNGDSVASIATRGVQMISRERAGHAERGFDDAHDNAQPRGDLAMAALLILAPIAGLRIVGMDAPAHRHAMLVAQQVWNRHPGDEVAQMAIAGSLVAAEIDRDLRERGGG